jgi:hypothetical protein
MKQKSPYLKQVKASHMAGPLLVLAKVSLATGVPAASRAGSFGLRIDDGLLKATPLWRGLPIKEGSEL